MHVSYIHMYIATSIINNSDDHFRFLHFLVSYFQFLISAFLLLEQPVSVCASMFSIVAFVNSSEMLSFVITLSRCSKNNCSYFLLKSVARVVFGCTVVIFNLGRYSFGMDLFICNVLFLSRAISNSFFLFLCGLVILLSCYQCKRWLYQGL